MFCNQCGAPFVTGAAVCGNCGHAIPGGMSSPVARTPQPVESHRGILGVLWLIL
jgi:hypothetical protein